MGEFTEWIGCIDIDIECILYIYRVIVLYNRISLLG